jgi:hypothetical protein
MPVEIRELILRATVVNNADQNGQLNHDRGDAVTPNTPSGLESSKEAIIAACTAQVLRILKRERER